MAENKIPTAIAPQTDYDRYAQITSDSRARQAELLNRKRAITASPDESEYIPTKEELLGPRLARKAPVDNEGATGLDYGKAAYAGVKDLAGSVGGVMEFAGAVSGSEGLSDWGNSVSSYWDGSAKRTMETLSPEGQRLAGKSFLGDEGILSGNGDHNFDAFLLKLARTSPTIAAGLIPGAAAGRAAGLAKVRGALAVGPLSAEGAAATAAAATTAATRASTIVGGATEGTLAAGFATNEISNAIDAMKPEDMATQFPEEWAVAMKAHKGDPAAAKEEIKAAAIRRGASTSAALSMATGAIGGAALSKVINNFGVDQAVTAAVNRNAIAKKIAGPATTRTGAAVKGGAIEGVQEGVQEFGEQGGVNVGLNQPLTQGGGEAFVGGALTGAPMGAATGAAFGPANPPQQATPPRPAAPVSQATPPMADAVPIVPAPTFAQSSTDAQRSILEQVRNVTSPDHTAEVMAIPADDLADEDTQLFLSGRIQAYNQKESKKKNGKPLEGITAADGTTYFSTNPRKLQYLLDNAFSEESVQTVLDDNEFGTFLAKAEKPKKVKAEVPAEPTQEVAAVEPEPAPEPYDAPVKLDAPDSIGLKDVVKNYAANQDAAWKRRPAEGEAAAGRTAVSEALGKLVTAVESGQGVREAAMNFANIATAAKSNRMKSFHRNAIVSAVQNNDAVALARVMDVLNASFEGKNTTSEAWFKRMLEERTELWDEQGFIPPRDAAKAKELKDRALAGAGANLDVAMKLQMEDAQAIVDRVKEGARRNVREDLTVQVKSMRDVMGRFFAETEDAAEARSRYTPEQLGLLAAVHNDLAPGRSVENMTSALERASMATRAVESGDFAELKAAYPEASEYAPAPVAKKPAEAPVVETPAPAPVTPARKRTPEQEEYAVEVAKMRDKDLYATADMFGDGLANASARTRAQNGQPRMSSAQIIALARRGADIAEHMFFDGRKHKNEIRAMQALEVLGLEIARREAKMTDAEIAKVDGAVAAAAAQSQTANDMLEDIHKRPTTEEAVGAVVADTGGVKSDVYGEDTGRPDVAGVYSQEFETTEENTAADFLINVEGGYDTSATVLSERVKNALITVKQKGDAIMKVKVAELEASLAAVKAQITRDVAAVRESAKAEHEQNMSVLKTKAQKDSELVRYENLKKAIARDAKKLRNNADSRYMADMADLLGVKLDAPMFTKKANANRGEPIMTQEMIKLLSAGHTTGQVVDAINELPRLTTVQDALNLVAATYPAGHPYNTLARAIKTVLGTHNPSLKFGGLDVDELGVAETSNKKVGRRNVVSADSITLSQQIAAKPISIHIFMHEAVHAATVAHMMANPKSATTLNLVNLYQALAKQSPSTLDLYGMTDVYEFIAEAYSNPSFQKVLRETRVQGVVSGGRIKNFFRGFVDAVRRILGMPIQSENYLDAVMRIAPLSKSAGFTGVVDDQYFSGNDVAAAVHNAAIADMDLGLDKDVNSIVSAVVSAANDTGLLDDVVNNALALTDPAALIGSKNVDQMRKTATVGAAERLAKRLGKEVERFLIEGRIDPKYAPGEITAPLRKELVRQVLHGVRNARREQAPKVTARRFDNLVNNVNNGIGDALMEKARIGAVKGVRFVRQAKLFLADRHTIVESNAVDFAQDNNENPLRDYNEVALRSQGIVTRIRKAGQLVARATTDFAFAKGHEVNLLFDAMLQSTAHEVDPTVPFDKGVNARWNRHVDVDVRAGKLAVWESLRADLTASAAGDFEAASALFQGHRDFYANLRREEQFALSARTIEAYGQQFGVLRSDGTMDADKVDALAADLARRVTAAKDGIDTKRAIEDWVLASSPSLTLVDDVAPVMEVIYNDAGKGPYFPLRRYGDVAIYGEKVNAVAFTDWGKAKEFAARINSGIAVGGFNEFAKAKVNPVYGDNPEVDEDGEPIPDRFDVEVTEKIYQLFDNEVERDAALEEVRKEFPEARGYTKTEAIERAANIDSAAAIVEKMTRDFSKMEGGAVFAQQAQIALTEAMAFKANAAAKLHRGNVRGADQNMLKALADRTTAAAWGIADIRTAGDKARSIHALREIANATGSTEMSDVVSTLVWREESVARDRNGVFGLGKVDSALAAGGFYGMLAGPSHSLINITGNVLLTFPTMGARFGYARTAKHMLSAMQGMLKPAAQELKNTKGLTKALPEETISLYLGGNHEQFLGREDVHGAIAQLVEWQLIDSSPVQDLDRAMSASSLPSNVAIANAGRRAWAAATNLARGMPTLIEQVNRITAARAAYELARSDADKPMSHAEAVEYARSILGDTHFDYSAENAALIFRYTPRFVMLFKKYSFGVYSLLTRLTYKSASGKYSKEEQMVARRALLGIMASHFVFAGVSGSLLMEPIRAMVTAAWEMLGGDDGEDWETLAEEFIYENMYAMSGDAERAKLYKDLLWTGIMNQATGMDWSSRVSLSHLLFFPRINFSGTPEESVNNLWLTMGGPYVGITANAWKGASMVINGRVADGLELMGPKVYRDISKGIRMGLDVTMNERGHTTMRQLDNTEMMIKMLGFAPTDVSQTFRDRQKQKRYEVALKDQRTKLMGAWYRADNKERIRIFHEDIRAWNAKHPESALKITMDRLIKGENEIRRAAKENRNFANNQYEETGRKLPSTQVENK